MTKAQWKKYFGELRSEYNNTVLTSHDLHMWALATVDPIRIAERECFKPTYGYIWCNFENACDFLERKIPNLARHQLGLF